MHMFRAGRKNLLQGGLRQVIAIKAANPRRALVTTIEGLSHVVVVVERRRTKKTKTLRKLSVITLYHTMGKMATKRNFFFLSNRLFGTKCDKCCRSFGPSDFVMRAKNKIFHLECFRCIACEKQLVPGDEFALRPDGLFCKEDHAGSWQSSFATATGGLEENNNHTEEDGGDLEDDDEQSQDGDKDLLLCSSHDRLADSGK